MSLKPEDLRLPNSFAESEDIITIFPLPYVFRLVNTACIFTSILRFFYAVPGCVKFLEVLFIEDTKTLPSDSLTVACVPYVWDILSFCYCYYSSTLYLASETAASINTCLICLTCTCARTHAAPSH